MVDVGVTAGNGIGFGVGVRVAYWWMLALAFPLDGASSGFAMLKSWSG